MTDFDNAIEKCARVYADKTIEVHKEYMLAIEAACEKHKDEPEHLLTASVKTHMVAAIKRIEAAVEK